MIVQKSRLFHGIKQVTELKNESSTLYKVIDMVFNNCFSANTEKNEFQLKFLKLMIVLMYIYVLAIVTMIFANDILLHKPKRKVPLVYYVF